MGKVLNELTGPQVFVFQNPRTKLHLTGGYNQPDIKKGFCGTKIKVNKITDARDIAPREGYRDHSKWCLRCLSMLDFEALDQKVVFSAIEIPSVGTYGQVVIAPHVSRRKPKLNLSPIPAKPQTYTPNQVAGNTIVTSRVKKKTATKPIITGGAIITAPAQIPKKRKTRSDKGVIRGPRNQNIDKGANINEESDVELQTVAKPESDASNGMD